jgi:hypothetical protein
MYSSGAEVMLLGWFGRDGEVGIAIGANISAARFRRVPGRSFVCSAHAGMINLKFDKVRGNFGDVSKQPNHS